MEIRLSDLKDKQVTTVSGERLGFISNVILDSTSNCLIISSAETIKLSLLVSISLVTWIIPSLMNHSKLARYSSVDTLPSAHQAAVFCTHSGTFSSALANGKTDTIPIERIKGTNAMIINLNGPKSYEKDQGYLLI